MVQRIHHQRSGAPDAIAVPRQSGLGFNASPSVVEESSTGAVPSPRGPRREDSFQPCGYEYPRGSRFDGVGRDPTLLACLPGIVNVHLPSSNSVRTTEHGYLDFAGVSCRPRCCALTYAVAQAARSSPPSGVRLPRGVFRASQELPYSRLVRRWGQHTRSRLAVWPGTD